MGNTIQKLIVMPSIGNYIRRVNVIKGSLYSRVYGISINASQINTELKVNSGDISSDFYMASKVLDNF